MLIVFVQSVVVFVVLILIMALLIYFARRFVVPQGSVKIDLNHGKKELQAPVGSKLLFALADNGIFLSSGCGGKGTCGQDKCRVLSGSSILPVEENFFSIKEAQDHWRLACQVTINTPTNVLINEDLLGAKEWEGTVVSNNNVSTFIKELDITLKEDLDFVAGGFMQIVIPPYEKIDFSSFDIDDTYKGDWEKFHLFNIKANNPEETCRAYSMANYPLEKNVVKLNVRIATPPFGKDNIPPGIASSYVFSLKPGDKVTLRGPYGEFAVQEGSDKEMIFIGGGAGMAPLRSEIFDQLLRVHTKRKMSYWYGARSKREIFYGKDFEKLAAEYDNFTWHVSLSEPLDSDNWTGHVGYIHNMLKDLYLSKLDAPEDCEYYMCGPPPMIKSVNDMLDQLGVSKHDIFYDAF